MYIENENDYTYRKLYGNVSMDFRCSIVVCLQQANVKFLFVVYASVFELCQLMQNHLVFRIVTSNHTYIQNQMLFNLFAFYQAEQFRSTNLFAISDKCANDMKLVSPICAIDLNKIKTKLKKIKMSIINSNNTNNNDNVFKK